MVPEDAALKALMVLREGKMMGFVNSGLNAIVAAIQDMLSMPINLTPPAWEQLTETFS